MEDISTPDRNPDQYRLTWEINLWHHIAVTHPNIITFYKSDAHGRHKNGLFAGLLDVYHRTEPQKPKIDSNTKKRIDLTVPLHDIRYCRTYSLWPQSMAIYDQLMSDLDNKLVGYPNLLTILDEAMVAAWYIGDKDLSKRIALQMIEFLERFPELSSKFDLKHYNHNLQFHGLSVPGIEVTATSG